MLTDYALAALSAVFAVRLRLRAGSFSAGSVGPWCLALAVIALAAGAGGTAHGFRLYLGEAAHGRVWQLTVALIGLSVVLALAAAIQSVLRPLVAPGDWRKAGHRWLKRGLYVTLAGLAIQQSGWDLHTHFNHNDLYHVVQMAGLYWLYRGARLLNDLGEP